MGRNRGGLTPSQRADVLSFAQFWRREATSGIIVDVPHGRPIERAAADSMREVQSILAAAGVPRNAIYVRTYKASGPTLASIKLNYAKLAAEAGPCGLWPHDLGTSLDSAYTENQPYWNLGCASQRNLAAMVANPEDLVQPRGEAPAYAPRRSVAIDHYRKGENPSGTYPGDYDKSQNQRYRQMIKHASQVAVADNEAKPAAADSAADEHIAPAPRVSVQAFCETVETAAAVQAAGEDRRLAKAHVKIQMGGIAAAAEAYRGLADAERYHHRIGTPLR